MDTPIGFATGSIWRWLKSDNRNELLDYIRPLGIQAVELTTGSEQELHALKLSDENITWLRGINHVSIHAPDLHNSAGKLDRLIRQLKALENLTALINACTVVIHIEDLPPENILEAFDIPVSIENTGPGNYSSPGRIAEILNHFPDFRLCLDLAHAALVSEQEAEALISQFRRRISHIHLSGIHQNADHESLIGSSDSFYRSIIPALNLEVPFLIEEDIRVKGIEYLREELTAANRLILSDSYRLQKSSI